MRRSLLTLAAVVVAMLFTAPTALAAGEGAWANSPLSAVAAVFDYGAPQTTKGDPFAAEPDATIYETYGFGFAEWRAPEVDEGWLPDIDLPDSEDIGNSVVNSVSSFGFQLLTIWLGLLYVELRLAFNPEALSLLEPVQRIGQEVFGERIFLGGAMGVAVIIAGVWLVAKARQAQVRAVANDASWVMLMLFVGIAAMAWPFTIAPAMDDALTGAVGVANTELAGVTGSDTTATNGATAAVHNALVYEVWCAGLLGRDAGEEIADEYCPRFLKASTFSYGELKDTEGDPDARADLSKAKYDDYQDAAKDLMDDSETAYAHLIGEKPWSRFGVVFLGWVGMIVSVPFLLVSAALLFYAMVVVRVALMLAPAIAVIAAYPPLKRHMLRLFDYVAACVMSALVMGVASAGYIAIVAGLMAPVSDSSAIVAFLVLGAVTWAFWALLKPHEHVMGLARWGGKGKNKKAGLLSETPASSRPDASGDGSSAPSDPEPAEAAPQPGRVASAMRGAAAGGMGTAAATVATGGTLGVATVAAGAMRGAGMGAVGYNAREVGKHSATLATIAALHPAPSAQQDQGAHKTVAEEEVAPAQTRAQYEPKHALPAGSDTRTNTSPTEDAPRATPRPTHETVIPSRVYMAGEATPDKGAPLVPPARTEDSHEPVYTIYQGEDA